MSKDFKRKLELYEKGALKGNELEEFEKELEKLEIYQEFLEEDNPEPIPKLNIDEKKQKRILRRSKWKARLQTAFTALGLLLLLTIISSILTSVYYSWGTPDRSEVFRNVIDHTLTVTNPYGELGGTDINATTYFGLNAVRDLKKQVGSETIKVGEINTNFLFSMMSYPERRYFGNIQEDQAVFTHPKFEVWDISDWERLEQLPEETVVSAYLSFTELIETEKVLQLFKGKNIDLLWLAVDTGVEVKEEEMFFEPFGFPDYPIWHDDDMKLESREVEKGLFGSQVISESRSSPTYHEGDYEMLHEQFLKTLNFLKAHERMANKLYYGELNLEKRIRFLEKNGFHHYGVVITGPTKEVLKLREESWVRVLEIDEVRLWNWDNLDSLE